MDKTYIGSIGIAGVGMVGENLARYFREVKSVEPILYDPPKNIGSAEELAEADTVFICVNTPRAEDGTADISQIKAVLDIMKDGQIAVIKSTVPPGTTRALAEKYENILFMFNPEFLTEATAYENMTAPARQIIGYLEDTEEIAKGIMEILPRAQYELICDAEEAEMVKYASNAFYATKVIFFNELFDICEAAKIDYEKIKEALKADPMTGPEHLEIWHKGYRGFGTPEVSKCLPKDVDALIAFSRLTGKYPELLRTVTKINHELAAMTAQAKAE